MLVITGSPTKRLKVLRSTLDRLVDFADQLAARGVCSFAVAEAVFHQAREFGYEHGGLFGVGTALHVVLLVEELFDLVFELRPDGIDSLAASTTQVHRTDESVYVSLRCHFGSLKTTTGRSFERPVLQILKCLIGEIGKQFLFDNVLFFSLWDD